MEERAQPGDVSAEIRRLRKARGLTLTDLSEACGLSVGYLSQVERNISSPSIKALHDIAGALGVSIGWFFDAPDGPPLGERRYIVRADRRRHLHFRGGITDSLLTPSLSGQLELLLSRFEAGATSGEEPYTHDGEEAGVVIEGSLDLWIGDEHFRLGEGDSFNFSSNIPHRYRNTDKREAKVIWVITPPSY